MRALSAPLPGVAARVAEGLWCTPPRAPLTDEARAVLAAGEPLTFERDGGRVSAWSWGDAGVIRRVRAFLRDAAAPGPG